MGYDKFPLRNVLKGRMLKIAELQDRVIIELSSRFGIILHGGTAIWRVYGGRRFSFDVDLYYKKPSDLLRYLRESGIFDVVKGKLTGSDVLYARITEGNAQVEINVSPLFREITDWPFQSIRSVTPTVSLPSISGSGL